MRSVNSGNGLRVFRSLVVLALSAMLPSSAQVLAQATGTPPAPADVHAQHAAQSSQANQELARQVAELRAQVAALQDALAAKHQGHPATQPAMGGTRQMMPGPMAGSPGMGMGMMGGEMGMMKGMMRMGAMPRMSGLPGFPGASHIYHIGATGFFLDHPSHITLTPEQQAQLNQIRESALLEQATLQRQIDQAEQELWQLTASDTPDAAKIEAKAREIAKLQADQRIAFIHAVGKAAGALTEEQRKQLTGMLPPSSASMGQTTPQGGGAGGMGDM